MAVTFRSVDAPTMTGHLPPSSSVQGTRFSAAARATILPTRVDPVYMRWSKGRLLNVAATSAWPVTTQQTLSS